MGYIYNDLKPDNMLIGVENQLESHSQQGESQVSSIVRNKNDIVMVDFGLLSEYMQPNGDHIKMEKINKFRGSFLFASKNAFNYYKTSRRDDFLSLMYNLVYMLDAQRLSILRKIKSSDDQFFDKIKAAKLNMTIDDLCGQNLGQSRAFLIRPFIEEVMSYSFSETPNYEKLKFLLEKVLLDRKSIPM